MRQLFRLQMIRTTTAALLLGCGMFGCSEVEQLPIVIPDPTEMTCTPKNAAQLADWKFALQPENAASLVKTAHLEFFDGDSKHPLTDFRIPVGRELRVVAKIRLGDKIKSAPPLATIFVQKDVLSGRGREETNGYANCTNDDTKNQTLTFERTCRPYDAGQYVIELRFHSYRLPKQKIEVIAASPPR